MNIQGKTFLVTGGASGLGGATARMIVGAGGNAVILDVNTEAGERMVAELGPRSLYHRTDVTSEDEVRAALAAGAERFSGVHGVVNAAGVATAATVGVTILIGVEHAGVADAAKRHDVRRRIDRSQRLFPEDCLPLGRSRARAHRWHLRQVLAPLAFSRSRARRK